MIIGSSISNENEIIVSVSVIYQNEGGVTGGIVAGVTNIEDKKIEKYEKREKGVKSNSKLNIKINTKMEISN